MTWLLDTNVCIVYLRDRDSGIGRRLQATIPSEVAVCSVVKAELYTGALRSRNPEQAMVRREAFLAPFVSLPFDDAAAEQYGLIRTALETAGTPIGPYDLQIAAIALSNALVLVTHNTREFSRIAGLRMEDWQVEAL